MSLPALSTQIKILIVCQNSGSNTFDVQKNNHQICFKNKIKTYLKDKFPHITQIYSPKYVLSSFSK